MGNIQTLNRRKSHSSDACPTRPYGIATFRVRLASP